MNKIPIEAGKPVSSRVFLCLRFLVLRLKLPFMSFFNSYPFGNPLLTVLHQARYHHLKGIAKNSSPPCAFKFVIGFHRDFF
jgi:hypothetical protein